MKHVSTYKNFNQNYELKFITELQLFEFINNIRYDRKIETLEKKLLNNVKFNDKCIAAFHNNMIIGFVCWSKSKSKTKQITNTCIDYLYVDPKYRNVNVATALIDYVINQDESGTIVVHPFSSSAEHFFMKYGFVFDETFGDDTNTLVYYHDA